ncbi:MAG: type II toxin-antitoxin system VapC family toxin [Propionibacteriaceae bacterium]|jgi:PIN domain nuclease of toxin-antitoxin system|nr:type II toxin-antitoxin system VapC family toxin [Propionibacteriaceae bacterium]
MRLLADTHILLWWLTDADRLTSRQRTLLSDQANIVLVSAVSIAEIEIKRSIGKLEIVDEYLLSLLNGGFDQLPLLAKHAALLGTLPWHHRDPFDRLLIAQAIAENIPIITADSSIRKYDVKTY